MTARTEHLEPREYWTSIRDKVCAKCIDSDGRGNCRLDPAIECALQKYLPLIVDAVNRVMSDEIADYTKELRAIVCAQCHYETAEGKCSIREEVDCALDRYFPLVIEAIGEVNARWPRA